MNPAETCRVGCPYCGEPNELFIDISVAQQEYFEDCTVCCRPMLVRVRVEPDAPLEVSVKSEEEA